ncbi:MAG: stage IV sporulation protein A [Clostridia bacterium]|nr:stage IV sporulation protein A [Clostridia bacterium]
MTGHSIYRDIAERTGGDIYIGVVGPVRTGKSTFIKRFMEALVLPNIEDAYSKERARDEMPQSAAGKTVMTTEPKFVPDEAVTINLDESASMRVKMIDCVGYIVDEALGTIENGQPRMVHTPWQEEPMPFREAAEMGTEKVIKEHSTIGMLITTDGTIGEISRESYVAAEERIVGEMKELGKPFAMVVNSKDPTNEASIELATSLEKKYGVPVALVSCIDLDAEDIRHILELVLYEFPVSEIKFSVPSWLSSLGTEHRICASVLSSVRECADKIRKTGDVKDALACLSLNDYVEKYTVEEIDLGTGCARVSLLLDDSLYYSIIGEMTGFEIEDEEQMISLLRELSEMKKRYDRISEALDMAEENGYGIVMPSVSELTLNEPEIVKQSGGYGVKLSASARSIHMIRANIETEINPIVGSEAQSEELVKYLLREFEEDPSKIWDSNVFGKSLYELVGEGLHQKLEHMSEESRQKLSETLERIINEGSGGLICIIL